MFEAFAAFAVLVLVGGVGWTFMLRFRKDPLRSHSLSPIGSAPEGKLIRVRGKVACSEPLKAPYTGRLCAYFRLELLYRASDKVFSRVHEACRDFTVTDKTGAAQILSERAAVEVVADFVEMERASWLSPTGRAVLAELGWELPEIASVELCEAVIPIDGEIEVAGSATREPGLGPVAGERGYREGPGGLLVFSGDTVLLGERRERRWIGGTLRA